jgi:hypothetical protein
VEAIVTEFIQGNFNYLNNWYQNVFTELNSGYINSFMLS